MADNMHILEISKNEMTVGINALIVKDNKVLLGLRIGKREALETGDLLAERQDVEKVLNRLCKES